MSEQSFETILYDVQDHIATVTINRPDVMNTFNKRMIREFSQLWHMIADDSDVHVVVLRAAPGRAFSSGADVKAAKAEGSPIDHPNIWSQVDPGDGLSPKLNRCWKPIVAAVHGICAAGAFYWINECDIVICSADATFFDPHVNYGLTAAVEPIGASYRLPLGDVLRMTLLGNDERMSAETALRIGLVTEVVALDQLWNRARELAAIIAAKPPAAIQGSVRAIWESLNLPRDAAIQGALKYCQLANDIGMAQIDYDALMAKPKSFQLR